MVIMQRVDPDENIDRFYIVNVQASLLDSVAVVIQYGSRQTAYQMTRVLPVESTAAGEELAAAIVAGKVRRGYQIVEGRKP